jgi:4-hydroxybenzoate polyprenyltransferase
MITTGQRRTLYVDLDGTLVHTDLLLESVARSIKHNPFVCLLIPFWAIGGRAKLKQKLAEIAPIPDVALLPFDPQVLDYVEKARRKGDRVVLATAADERLARAVAEHLGIFDDVIASDGARNLKSAQKLAAIQQDARGGAFEYVGDSVADLAIWQCATRAVVTNASPRLVSRLRSAVRETHVLSARKFSLAPVLRAMRPHQWAKNILLFIPVIAAHRFSDLHLVAASALGFVSFSLCASAVYLTNDLLDLDADRQHSRKRYRPLACGELPISTALVIIPLLLAAAAMIALKVSGEFALVLAIYLALTLSYSWFIKELAILDTIVLAGLYTIRIEAGFVATTIIGSFWLFGFALFLFYSLAMLKRYSEVDGIRRRNLQLAHGRGYFAGDAELLGAVGVGSGLIAILVFALYINSADVSLLYPRPQMLWAVVPLLLYWITRLWLLAHRGEIDEDPLVFALTDKMSLTTIGLCVVIGVLATL